MALSAIWILLFFLYRINKLVFCTYVFELRKKSIFQKDGRTGRGFSFNCRKRVQELEGDLDLKGFWAKTTLIEIA